MSSIDALLELLIKMMREPATRKASVKQFQALVWACPKASMGTDTYDAVADLALDLDFFEPDPFLRRDGPDYYGHERLEVEVQTTLRRLEQLGVKVSG